MGSFALFVSRPLDLDLELELSWSITTDFGAAGQTLESGFEFLLGDGATKRRLVFDDAQVLPNPAARLKDGAGASLGTAIALASGSSGQVWLRVQRDDQGQFRWFAKTTGDVSYSLLYQETPSAPGIIKTEVYAKQGGPASPAFSYTFTHEYVDRVVGTPLLGSTLDLSFLPGTVFDDAFDSILDKIIPSGLKAVVKE